MDAAQLVEERKAGKITQQEFFTALNRLRRVNCSSIGAISVSREATENKCQLGDRKPRRNAKETNPEAGGDRASRSLDDGERGCVTALSYVNKFSSPRSCRSDETIQQFPAESDDSARLKTFHDLNEGRVSGNLTDSFSTPGTVHSQRRPLPPGKFAEGDSEWLFSPLGETEIYCQRRSRKTPESRGAYYGGSKTMTTRTLYGDSAAPSKVQPPQRTKARLVDSWTPQPPWRPAGGCTPMLYEEVMRPHCDRSSAVRNDVYGEKVPQRAKGEGDTHAARFDCNKDGHHRHEGNGGPRSASRERSPVTMSPSRDETRRGLMTEAGRGTTVKFKDTSPILDSSSNNTGPRHQESSEQTSFTTYENPSRREHLRYYTKARVDRDGYPLHKNGEDLVNTGVAGDRAGLLFAPVIKGLRGKSSKQGSSRFSTEQCYSEQPVPLYERAMDWKEKADELRFDGSLLHCPFYTKNIIAKDGRGTPLIVPYHLS